MSILKKTAVALTAVMVSATLFGCADTSYIMKANDEKVTAGIYLYYASSQLNNQITTLQYTGVTEDYLDQKIGDETLKEYVADTAMDSIKEHAAINAKFAELGLELSEDDEKEVSDVINESWKPYTDIYEAQGIGKESFESVVSTSKKNSMLFDYYYSKEGVEAVSDEDIVNYIEENYLRYKVMSFAKSTEEGEEDTAKTSYEKYLKKAEKTSFADFDELIEELNEEQSTEATTTSNTEETEETEKDPYENEQMTNYTEVDESSEETFDVVLKEIKGMKNGEVSSYEDDLAYYIYIKGDITERSKEYTEADNRSTTLQTMKGEAFQDKIDQWVNDMKFDVNDKALNRYSVETIYKKLENASK